MGYGIACLRAHSLAWLLGLTVALGSSGTASAQKAKLACAVEASKRVLSRDAFCEALGRALGRPVVPIDDAREAKQGESVQVLQSDVQWIVIWLVQGHVRAWTRVSQIEAADQQVATLVRAASALPRSLPEPPACVRLDPNGGYRVRSADLTYPWAELKPCKRKAIEVTDPWWQPRSER